MPLSIAKTAPSIGITDYSYLAAIDESGTGAINDLNQNGLFYVAVLGNLKSWAHLNKSFINIVESFEKRHKIEINEFHSKDLWHGKEPFTDINRSERKKFFSEIYEACNNSEIRWIIFIANRPALRSAKDECNKLSINSELESLAETRIALYLNELIRKINPTEKCAALMDARKPTNIGCTASIKGFNNLLDNGIKFVNSREYIPVQIADAAVYCIQMCSRDNKFFVDWLKKRKAWCDLPQKLGT